MKKVLFFVLVVNFSFSQTDVERANILNSTDVAARNMIKSKYEDYTNFQKYLISDYVKNNFLTEINSNSLQRIVDGNPIYFSNDNASSITTIRGNALHPGGSLGLNLTGQGITVGVWDGGKVRDTHQEFSGRIILGDGAATLNGHATHVTGTIVAQGVSLSRKGFAYQANAMTHDWNNDINEMITYASNGYLVSNHSYGNIAANLQTYYFGNYNIQSIEVDDVMNAFPYYQVVKSAGNDRATTSIFQVGFKGGYDLLSGVSTAKNVLTIAAVEHVNNYTSADDVNMSSFSNWGPTDDGRIKPDISAKGVNISSCNSTSNVAYTQISGTSMASPAITGLIALLQKHYNNLNPGTYMKSSSVRALLCQSAREAGLNTGPDYEFGWGLADGFNAARVITNKGTTAIFDELTLQNSAVLTKSFTISSPQDLNVVIAWTDPVGIPNANNDEDNRTARLINNLDLKVLKDGVTYYPWKLNPDDPAAGATNSSDNDVDNIERVEIFNATPGVYTIQVSHKGSLQNDFQDFALIATATNSLTLNNDDFSVDNSFFVYPNPASSELYFTNPNNFELSSISISDISGKQVVSLNAVKDIEFINVSNLQAGVYFVTFTTDTNSVVKKFIKN